MMFSRIAVWLVAIIIGLLEIRFDSHNLYVKTPIILSIAYLYYKYYKNEFVNYSLLEMININSAIIFSFFLVKLSAVKDMVPYEFNLSYVFALFKTYFTKRVFPSFMELTSIIIAVLLMMLFAFYYYLTIVVKRNASMDILENEKT